MAQVCVTCLTKERQLETLGNSGNYDIIKHLFLNNSIGSMLHKKVAICWECTAQLNNVRKFQKKASKSLRRLKCYYSTSFHKRDSLSNLVTSAIACHNIKEGVQVDPLLTIGEDEVDDNVLIKKEVQSDEEDYFTEVLPINHNGDADTTVSYATMTADEPGDEIVSEGSVSEDIVRKRRRKKRVRFQAVKRKKAPSIPRKNAKEDVVGRLCPITKDVSLSWTTQTLSEQELLSLLDEERSNKRFVERPSKCDTCITSFWYEKELADHNVKFHHKTCGEHTCDICRCRFETEEKLKEHRLLHYVLYKCSTCNFKTQLITRIIMHVDNMHYNAGYKCKECDNYFPKHKRTLKPIACTKCNKSIKGVELLTSHMKQDHAEDEKVFCDVCKKTYKSMALYQIHLKLNRNHIAPEKK